MSKWRIAGRVKQARKRAQKRVDIRMGRVLSMQQMLANTAHAQRHLAETPVETANQDWYAAQIGEPEQGTHQLVNKETGQVLQAGTESQMRKQRAISLEANPEGTFSVRKVK